MGSKSNTKLMKTKSINKEEVNQNRNVSKDKSRNKKKENAQDIISKSMCRKVNEIKVSYHERILSHNNQKIKSSSDAAEILYEYWDKNTIGLHESFKVVLLNNNNKIRGIYLLSQGGITGTVVDIRILFSVILKTLSVAIILAHNHPSGTLKASAADREITNKIVRAAKLFDIKVLDHLIIVPNGDYYSFSDNDLL